MIERINPLARRPAEVATANPAEVAVNPAEPTQLNLQPVVCGEFGKSVPALADLAQRIVVPMVRR